MGSVLVLTPFLIMLLGSLLPKSAILQRSFTLGDLTLSNYPATFEVVPFGRFYLNSLIVATGTTVVQILTASLAAFAFARLRFKGRDALFLVYLATLMIPFQVTMIPNFIIIRYLRWYNTYQALILPAAFSVFSTFLVAPVFSGHSDGHGRGGAHRRGGQFSHLGAGDFAAGRARVGHAGDLQFSGFVERFSLAASYY